MGESRGGVEGRLPKNANLSRLQLADLPEGEERPKRTKAAAAGSVAGSRAAGDVEEDLRLCPVEDRRRLGGRREGLLEGFSPGSYLFLFPPIVRGPIV